MERQEGRERKITRREFIQVTGAVVFVAGIGACGGSATEEPPAPTQGPAPTNTAVPTATSEPTPVPPSETPPPAGVPPADGYLLVDVLKCQGCASCMLACSLIHEGVEALSLSRIQIMQDSFASFPGDLDMAQCRQCIEPACVAICPTGALSADARFGNVRMVDKEKCIGCGLCFQACPYTPSRAFLAPDSASGGEAKSRKCDLCANAPYHWDGAGGGPDGKQACVEVCPVGAIEFTKQIPTQEGNAGYRVNLRNENWANLGYPTN